MPRTCAGNLGIELAQRSLSEDLPQISLQCELAQRPLAQRTCFAHVLLLSGPPFF